MSLVGAGVFCCMLGHMENLYKALIAAQAEFAPLDKTAENPHFRNKFVPLSEVLKNALPILSKHGLGVMQWPVAAGWNTGGDGPYLLTVLVHESGEKIEHAMALNPVKNDPQAHGSAITYARRYALMSILGLVGDEDDDANQATAPAARKVKSERVRPQAPDSELDRAKEQLRAAIKSAGLTGEQAAEYGWVKTATAADIDNIKGLTLALESGHAV